MFLSFSKLPQTESTMLIRCGLLLAIISCVRTRDDFHHDKLLTSIDSDYNRQFSLWPSVHNAATMLRIRRESQVVKTKAVETQEPVANIQGVSEGVGDPKKPPVSADHPQETPAVVQPPTKITNVTQETPPPVPPAVANAQPKEIGSPNETPKEKTALVPPSPTVAPMVTISDNGTSADKATKKWDLSNPEATKRGLIVFGGFALLAMAYFIFYRTKSKFNETNNPNGVGESNQFRYGVLQSDDRRDNLELSRVPLTMESDDEEDEDLEIFDLEEKKKSLSYVNLQANDEDIVLSPRHNINRDDLLLDIEDGNSDILINWSNNGSKSIL